MNKDNFIVQIFDSRDADLFAICNCHSKAFPSSLSSKLGISFLVKMFDWYLREPKAFLFHAISVSGEMLGYCGGYVVDGSFGMGSASSMAQHSFWAAVWAFLKRPWLLLHQEMFRKYRFALKNFSMKLIPGMKPGKMKPKSINSYSGLVVIGVDKIFQGKGVSQKLLDEFEKKSKEFDLSLMRLTVLKENKQAIAAYRKNGWEIYLDKGITVGMEKEIS